MAEPASPDSHKNDLFLLILSIFLLQLLSIHNCFHKMWTGGSCGSAVQAAMEAASELETGQTCVVVLPDSIRNYMTKHLSDKWMMERDFIKEEEDTKNKHWLVHIALRYEWSWCEFTLSSLVNNLPHAYDVNFFRKISVIFPLNMDSIISVCSTSYVFLYSYRFQFTYFHIGGRIWKYQHCTFQHLWQCCQASPAKMQLQSCKGKGMTSSQ